MRNAGRLILGFYPLPAVEARRLGKHLNCASGAFSAIDPCVGDGVAFVSLVAQEHCRRYGIELDAFRAEQAQGRRIQVIQGDALEVRCSAESVSLLYLNPPYDLEAGSWGNRRFEELFLQHTYRWLKRSGVLVFVIPRRQLGRCSALLAEYFSTIRIYRLTSPECVQYNQVVVLASRRGPQQNQSDQQLRTTVQHLQKLATEGDFPPLTEEPNVRYEVPVSGPVTLLNRSVPLDEVEDVLPKSSAYLQAARLLVRQPAVVRGRPITQLHGGHVALLAASGALNGVFGEGPDRHMANWSPSRMFHHSVQTEEDGTITSRKWSSFSPKLLLLYENGSTHVLAHKKSKPESEDDGQHELVVAGADLTQAPTSEPLTASPSPDTIRSQARRTVRRRISLKS